jgi:hypothetical protein
MRVNGLLNSVHCPGVGSILRLETDPRVYASLEDSSHSIHILAADH